MHVPTYNYARKLLAGQWVTAQKTGDLFDLGEGVETLDNLGGLVGVAEDDQDAVIAAQSAHDFGPFFPVQGLGDGLGAARQSADDDEVAGAFGTEVKGRQEPGDRGSLVPCFRRERLVGAAFG